jgi:alkyl hydroperoxide reductase subunit AhpC
MPSYEDDLSRFEEYNTQVLGISVDSIPSHEAWQKSIGGISYPLCSDFNPHGAVAEKYGVLREQGMTERALFVIDTDGIIQYIDVHPIDDQPDNEDIFDVLRKLNA